MIRPAYRANGPDRCFHCKDELFSRISDAGRLRHRLDAVAYGENADDARRPTGRAPGGHQPRVLRPLADAGLTKADVRSSPEPSDLPSADKPAAPCLASRIPHFDRWSARPSSARSIGRRRGCALGFADLRVRHHGDVARIELPAADLVRAVTDPLRGRDPRRWCSPPDSGTPPSIWRRAVR